MSFEPVTVDVERNFPLSDAGGGEVDSWQPLYVGLVGTINFRRTIEQFVRSETTGFAAQGPGVATRQKVVVKFEPNPQPAVVLQVNDRLTVRKTGQRVLVVNVRSYEFTLQLDGEVIN